MSVATLAAAPAVTAAPVRRFGLGARALDVTAMSLPEILQVCEILAKAGDAIPKSYRGKKESIFAAVMHGASLGLQPMQALQGITVVDGTPSLSAALLGALVMDAGHDLHVDYDDAQAVARLTRADTGKQTTVTWTLERAKNAGLCQLKDGRPWAKSQNGKPLPWMLFPGAMLRSRAVAEVCRAACPDTLFGLGVQYTTEELGVVVDQDGLPVGGEIERYPDPREIGAQALADQAQAATTRAHIETLAAEAETKGLTGADVTIGGVRGALRGYLGARWKALPGAVVSEEDPVRAAALSELYGSAQDAGFISPEHLATVYEAEHGHSLNEATAEQLQAFAGQLGDQADDDGEQGDGTSKLDVGYE